MEGPSNRSTTHPPLVSVPLLPVCALFGGHDYDENDHGVSLSVYSLLPRR